MKKNIQRLIGLSIMLCLTSTFIFAQKGNLSKLSIKQIMQGPDFVGHLPSRINWSDDSKTIYFNWNPEDAISDSLYAYQLSTEKILY